jgi:hypothetical protein
MELGRSILVAAAAVHIIHKIPPIITLVDPVVAVWAVTLVLILVEVERGLLTQVAVVVPEGPAVPIMLARVALGS